MNVIFTAKVNKKNEFTTFNAKNFSEKHFKRYFEEEKAVFPASKNEMKLLTSRS